MTGLTWGGNQEVLTNRAAGDGGSASTAALADAAGLVERAIDAVRAAGDVEWESRAADLYRADAVAALHGLAQDQEVLAGVARQADGAWLR